MDNRTAFTARCFCVQTLKVRSNVTRPLLVESREHDIGDDCRMALARIISTVTSECLCELGMYTLAETHVTC